MQVAGDDFGLDVEPAFVGIQRLLKNSMMRVVHVADVRAEVDPVAGRKGKGVLQFGRRTPVTGFSEGTSGVKEQMGAGA